MSKPKQAISLCVLWHFNEQYFEPHLGQEYLAKLEQIEHNFLTGYKLQSTLIVEKLGISEVEFSKPSSLINFFKLKSFLKWDSFFYFLKCFLFCLFFPIFFYFFPDSPSSISYSSLSTSSASRFGDS